MTVPPLATSIAKALLVPIARRIPDLVLGSKAERELAKCVAQGLHEATSELAIPGPQVDSLSLILTETFSRPLTAISSKVWTPSDGSLSVLIRDQIAGHLAVLSDPELTGVAASSLELLGIDTDTAGNVITRYIFDAIVQHGIRPESPLYLLADIINDEIQHNELLAAISGLRADLGSLIPVRGCADYVGAVSLVDRQLTVPDGTNSVVIRLAVTNTSREQQRLSKLVLNVAESRPSDVIRLRQAGAPLQEYDLAVDLRGVSSVDALKGAAHQFVLPSDESEAFRITATVVEGTRYKLVIHPEFESILARRVAAGMADQLTVDFPLQSVEAMRKAGLL